jgi:hypothetical protein
MLWNPINADVATQRVGEIVRAGAAPNTVVLALANALEGSSNIVGSRLADVASGNPGLVQPAEPGYVVRMLLEPTINDPVYLSATTPGRGTNVMPAAPNLTVLLGLCYEKNNVGGVWYASLLPATVNAMQNSPGAIDAFGRLRVSNPEVIFDSKMIVDNDPTHWDDQQTSGGGTSSTFNANQGSVTLAVSNLTAGTRVRQTYRRFTYQPGKSQLFAMTGILGAPAAGITRRIGSFDGSNGIFFESGPANVAVVIRTSTSGAPVDVRVPQSSWNYDKMDGAGPSGLTLDPSKTQIFMFDFQWLGVGRVRLGFDIEGSFQLVHEFNHANLDLLVYMSTPNGPLRYEISNSGAGGAASLLHICTGVISEGEFDTAGTVRTVSRNATPLVTTNTTDLFPLLAIRQKSGYEGSNVRPVEISGLSTTNANIELQLLLNPTLGGAVPTLTYNPVTGSVVEASNGALNTTTVSGGILLASAVVAAGGQIVLNSPSDYQLGVSIAGVRDFLVLAVRRLTGATETIYGTLSWREIF